MARRGLTLLELMIVIAVVALLLTLSFPALMRARNEAQSAVCCQNLKTLSLAWLLYKDDNDDRLVGGYVDPAGKRPLAWVHAPTGTGSPIDCEKEGIRQGALFSYVGRTLDPYNCPADGSIPVRNQPAFRSYSIADGANGEAWQNTYTLAVTYPDIQRPATKYVFVEEADERGWNRGSWVLDLRSQAWVDPLAVWHSETKSTLGYADGHTEIHRWVDRSTIEMFEKQEFGWPVPANEGDDLRFMLSGFPQKITDSAVGG
jgi:prepilin-type N-terminal cleavage/methylation domain-containing protein